MLCALIFGLWACTPEAIPPPEPAPPLAAGAPQGNPEDVQEECQCQMSILGVDGGGAPEFLMPDYIDEFDFTLDGVNGVWLNITTGQQGDFPTPFIDLPGTWDEADCERFQLISFDPNFTVHVTVRCFAHGKDASPDSQVWDDFAFSEANDIDWNSSTATFLRQYICRSRTSDEPNPCKQGPTPGEPPVKKTF
ncbi:MAG: hypothetical protein D6694_11320 [Gammaproteobacteria bacterium]|nr:MAG: hypothetical protein D6694_11320 [Gammaproteobacteria bacterium]